MHIRHAFLAIAIATSGLTATGVMNAAPAAAQSDGHVPFTQKAFEAAKSAGKPILVDVYAPWCPVCAKQQPAIAAAQKDPRNKDLVVFQLDFDSQKSAQRPLRVTRQSTLIAFDGGKETGRLVGATNPKQIAQLIATTR